MKQRVAEGIENNSIFSSVPRNIVSNAKKPGILCQLFKCYIIKNRSHNGKKKGIFDAIILYFQANSLSGKKYFLRCTIKRIRHHPDRPHEKPEECLDECFFACLKKFQTMGNRQIFSICLF